MALADGAAVAVAATPLAPPLPGALVALVPANPCMASTMTSGGGLEPWQAGTTPAMAEVNTIRGTKRGDLMS